MNAVFADTFYFIALLNRNDKAHPSALAFAAQPQTKIVTTAWVLTEVADALAATNGRTLIAGFVADLAQDPNAVVRQLDAGVWAHALQLYSNRLDKQWSLTDCTSFITMTDLHIPSALTADHHFEQAGFQAILK